MKKLTLGAIALALTLSAAATTAFAGEAVSMTLVPRSRVLQFCASCTEPAGRPENLTGAFSLTPLALTDGNLINALTDVRWESASYKITGTGFIQVDRSGRLQVELRAVINGEEMHLRATRRQPQADGTLNIVLATPRDAEVGYLIVISARAEMMGSTDRDADTIGDEKDNCRANANAEQTDADGDTIGDACDRCPETPQASLVNGDGCSLDQLCPCESPRGGGTWTRGAYAKCVARSVRELRRLGLLSRGDAAGTMRRALQNGCGQTVVACAARDPFAPVV